MAGTVALTVGRVVSRVEPVVAAPGATGACPAAVKLMIVGGGCVITVKVVALVVLPPGVVTVIGPVVAPPGTMVVRLVAEAVVTVARTPLNFTSFWLATGSKSVPVIVTDVPAGPLSGMKLVMAGAATVVNWLVNGAMDFPAVSLMSELSDSA